MEKPFMEIDEINDPGIVEFGAKTVFGMINNSKHEQIKEDLELETIMDAESVEFNQLNNVFINLPNYCVKVGNKGIETKIKNATIIASTIQWSACNINIESYKSDGCLIVSKNNCTGDLPTFVILNGEELKVSIPNIHTYYRLVDYKYDFEDDSSIDITKYMHALHCILIEFRAHKKDTPAKTAERITNVTVGKSKIKQEVFDFLLRQQILYPCEHLYKIDMKKMQEYGINYNALGRMDSSQLEKSFLEFIKQKS